MGIRNIHRKLIIRLILIWAILSLFVGSVVYLIEIKKVDEYVGKMAAEESRGFIPMFQNYLNNPGEEYRAQMIQESQRHLRKKHFVMMDLYNRNKQMIMEMREPESQAVEEKIRQHSLVFFMDNEVHYKKFYGRSGQIYVLVLTPLKTGPAEIIGYVNGVYKVPAGTMSEIRNRVGFSLLQVILAIFLTTAVIYPVILLLNRGLMRLMADLSHANIGMLKVLGSAVAKRDSDTNVHNYRVTIYSVRLAELIGLKEKEMQALIKGSFLHDVGKIAISDNILLKPGKLTDDEFATMKTHVSHGLDIIANYVWLKDAADIVLYHHEKFNGTGYAAALQGRDIPVHARIFAIADVFDALTSKRPYKEPVSFEETMQIMNAGKGTHFDPYFLDEFNKIAQPLYLEVSHADDYALEELLTNLINGYFSR